MKTPNSLNYPNKLDRMNAHRKLSAALFDCAFQLDELLAKHGENLDQISIDNIRGTRNALYEKGNDQQDFWFELDRELFPNDH